MKEFALYHANDPKKEIIHRIKADDLSMAILIFCELKGLSLSDFLNIFRVKEI